MAFASVVSGKAPAAFLCAHCDKEMKDPVLALCGHLFERACLPTAPFCPKDRQNLDVSQVVPFAELRQRIDAWQAAKMTRSMSKVSIQKPLEPVFTISNAHQDDIHGFVQVSPDSFASASKDATLKLWSTDGSLLRELQHMSGRDYRYWGTALSSLPDGSWISGSRDGDITQWSQKGELKNNGQYRSSGVASACKDRNQARVNCITPISEDTVLLGVPRAVVAWDLKTSKVLCRYEAHPNDWVYCIECLENKDLLVVIGSVLELWHKNEREIEKTSLLLEDIRERRPGQRPHISAIKRLEHDRDLLANALFDGTVKILNLATRKLVRDYKEHGPGGPKQTTRVWSVENLFPQVFASSGDDGTIKIWDVRQGRSVATIGNQPGRVSSLLRIAPEQFISAACPDDLRSARERASISFWDIRALKEGLSA